MKTQLLYHYCSVETFFNIIKSKRLRLCNSRKSNDFLELEFFLDRYLSHVNASDKGGGSSKKSILNNPPYISCFSKEGDLLSQWRGYASDGTGIAIGFRFFTEQQHNFSLDGITLSQLENDVPEDFLLDVVYDNGQNNIEDLIFKLQDTLNKDDKKSMTMQMITLFSCVCKNGAFKEEQEVRMIRLPQGNDKGHLEYVRNGEINGYYEHEIASNEIKEIVLGPKCKMREDDMELKHFLNKHKMGNVKIRKSEASYR